MTYAVVLYVGSGLFASVALGSVVGHVLRRVRWRANVVDDVMRRLP